MAENKSTSQEINSAILEGNLEEVRRLITNLEDIPASLGILKNNFILKSLENKHLEIAKLLIGQCGRIPQYQKLSVLHSAVLHGDVDIINMLINGGCSLKMKDKEGRSLLHVFAKRVPVDEECSRILDYILNKKISINIKHPPTGFSPIHFAAECGNANMITLLLKKNSHLNGKANHDCTPLHIAAANGQAEAARVLLVHRAKKNAKDSSLKSPLCLAVEKQHLPTIETIIKFKSFVDDDMLLDCALETRNHFLVEMLIRRGANPSRHSIKSGKVPLQVAVENGYEEIVRVLLLFPDVHPNRTEVCFSKDQTPCLTTVLHIAAERNHPGIISLLLEHGANPEVIDEKGRTPLHFATEHGSIVNALALLSSNCHIPSLFTPQESDGCTPLHIAVENGHEDLVSLFLNLGISPNNVTKNGFSCIHIAAIKGNVAVVRLLIKFGVRPNVKALDSTRIYGYFPMYLAAAVGSLEIVNMIYMHSTSALDFWEEGFDSLYVAAYQGHGNIVEWLIEKNAHSMTGAKKFLSPLHVAAQRGHLSIVLLLLKYGLDINPRDGKNYPIFSTPLIAACHEGHEAVVAALVNRGADLNAKLNSISKVPDSDLECFFNYGYPSYSRLKSEGLETGYMPIHFATKNGKKSIVKILLRGGADVNSKAANNSTPLSIAVAKENVEIVAFLLECGANPMVEESDQPLILTAILKKNAAIVDLLLKFKTSLNFTFTLDSTGDYTPLLFAIAKSSLDVVETLLRNGAEINVKTQQGFPLHLASDLGREDVANKLIEYGARVDVLCSRGYTPLFHSVKKGGRAVFKLLLLKGASFEINENRPSLLETAIDNDVEDDFIQLIVECGENVNERDRFGFSLVEKILQNAEMLFMQEDGKSQPRNYIQLMEFFLKNGLDVNTRVGRINERPDTILHLATNDHIVDVVELLLQYDADVNILDQKGHTPFWYAVKQASTIVEFESNPINRFERDLENFAYGIYYFGYSLSNPSYYENLCRSCEKNKRIARLLTQAIARIEAAGGEVDPENLALINEDFVKPYYYRCQREIEEMKQKEVIKQVSYFDILKANERKLAVYSRIPNIIKAFQTDDFKQQFPLYARDLRVRIERGWCRAILLEMSVSFLNKALKFRLPILIIHEIFEYLSSVDLRSLCRALFNRLIFVSPDK